MAPRQPAGEPRQQAAGEEDQSVAALGGNEQRQSCVVALRQVESRARIGLAAESPVEGGAHGGCLASGEATARQLGDLGKAGDADAPEQFERGAGDIGAVGERGQWQGTEWLCQRSCLGDRAARPVTCQPAGGQWRGGAGEAGVQPEFGQPPGDEGGESLQAAKELQAGGYFEQHAIGWVDADRGREGAGPGGDFGEQLPGLVGVVLQQFERGGYCQCAGQAVACGDAELSRSRIRRHHPRPGMTLDQGQRRGIRRSSLDRLERGLGQDQGEPQHG